MFAQCPECQTVFKVTPAQLQVARGKVRCGHCQHVFNALLTLTESPAEATPPNQTIPDPEPPAREHSISDNNDIGLDLVNEFLDTNDEGPDEAVKYEQIGDAKIESDIQFDANSFSPDNINLEEHPDTRDQATDAAENATDEQPDSDFGLDAYSSNEGEIETPPDPEPVPEPESPVHDEIVEEAPTTGATEEPQIDPDAYFSDEGEVEAPPKPESEEPDEPGIPPDPEPEPETSVTDETVEEASTTVATEEPQIDPDAYFPDEGEVEAPVDPETEPETPDELKAPPEDKPEPEPDAPADDEPLAEASSDKVTTSSDKVEDSNESEQVATPETSQESDEASSTDAVDPDADETDLDIDIDELLEANAPDADETDLDIDIDELLEANAPDTSTRKRTEAANDQDTTDNNSVDLSADGPSETDDTTTDTDTDANKAPATEVETADKDETTSEAETGEEIEITDEIAVTDDAADNDSTNTTDDTATDENSEEASAEALTEPKEGIGKKLVALLARISEFVHSVYWSFEPVLLSTFVLLLVTLFIGQATYFWRNDLGQRYPEFRPTLEKICTLMNCELALYKDVSRITLIDREVRTHMIKSNALQVMATFTNEAKYPQPYPVLKLSLSNRNGQLVAQRKFLPSEYLEPTINVESGMQPNTPVNVNLEIEDPDRGAVGFAFDFL